MSTITNTSNNLLLTSMMIGRRLNYRQLSRYTGSICAYPKNITLTTKTTTPYSLSRWITSSSSSSSVALPLPTLIKRSDTLPLLRPSLSSYYNISLLETKPLSSSFRWFSSTSSSSSGSSNTSTAGTTEPPNPPPQGGEEEPKTNASTSDPIDGVEDVLDTDGTKGTDGTTTTTTTAPVDDLEDVIDEEPIVVEEEDASIGLRRQHNKQIREMKDALLRSLAEQENTRTIAKRDVEQARQYAIKSFAKSLLDVADNLQRALDAVPQEYRPSNNNNTNTTNTPTEPLVINPDIFKTLYEGIEMTEKGLKRALENHGVQQFGQVGDIFDPNKHEALMEYNDNTKINNTVGIVMKCGYTLNTRILRPAEVGVVKSTLTTTTDTSSSTTTTETSETSQ